MKLQQHGLKKNLARSAAVASLGLALAGGVATAAQASQGATLNPGNVATFNTYFWGRTTACFTNSTGGGAHFEWRSSTSYNTDTYVGPHSTYCLTRSFVGFQLRVHNYAYSVPLSVTFPYGP